jgi:hypothetical protein
MFQNGTQIKAVMTNEERLHLMAQLIQTGLWNADEPGDPTRDEDAAKDWSGEWVKKQEFASGDLERLVRPMTRFR